MTIRCLAGWLLAVACLAIAGCSRGGDDDQPVERALRLHPDNPRYLEFRGEPTVLITSGEHYGAVVNADFDYIPYLDELASHGFNLTRVFSGSYIEPGGPTSEDSPDVLSLRYQNTLAPRPGRFVAPWADSGAGKFDLTRWNPEYFQRLKHFLREAGRRGIVVELVLFSTLYESATWELSPFNARNNVNGVGEVDISRVYTLENGGLLEHQDALVRKLVAELRSFDNVYYEVINEGWAEPSPASDSWQDHIIDTIEDAESDFDERHLIARNYRHDTGRIRDPHPSVSIFNFHYQRDISEYGNLEGVLSFDETGFQGSSDEPYRADAWFFMLSGGGIYDNLDWSFTPDQEDGRSRAPAGAPGGGGLSLRRSLAVLKRFLERFDLPRMSPSHEIVRAVPPGALTRTLADPGSSYAIYVGDGRPESLVLDLPPGNYRVEWVDTEDGQVERRERLDHPGFEATLTPPPYEHDIALSIEAE